MSVIGIQDNSNIKRDLVSSSVVSVDQRSFKQARARKFNNIRLEERISELEHNINIINKQLNFITGLLNAN